MEYAKDTKNKNNNTHRFNFDQAKVVKPAFVNGGKNKSKSAEVSSIESKRNSSAQVLERWSPTKRHNFEVTDSHPSVPLEIALLHIETDALLESLRQSAITPKVIDQLDELSPTATNSTSGSTSLQVLERWSPTKRHKFDVTGSHPSVPLEIALLHIKTDALLESLRQSAITPKAIDQFDELSPTATISTSGSTFTGTSFTTSSTPRDESIVSIRNSCQLKEDDSSVLSGESDDGMSGEIQNLNKLTTDMQQSFADLRNTEAELEYEDFLQHSEHNAVLFVRDLLMVCENVSHAIIHSQSVKMLLHSKGGIYLLQSLRTRARYTIAFLYILLSFASICIKTGINRLVSS